MYIFADLVDKSKWTRLLHIFRSNARLGHTYTYIPIQRTNTRNLVMFSSFVLKGSFPVGLDVVLKGLSHEIFMGFLLEWIYLGLNRNRFWFFNFKEGPSH
jgi:hypothetical protein